MSRTFFEGDAKKVSRYYERFQRIESAFMELKGDMILVERLPKVELKTASGIILPHDVKTYKDTHSDRTTDFGIVLMTGPGPIFDDGTTGSCEAKPGDVVLLPGNVSWYSAFGTMKDYEAYGIGMVRDAQIMMHFKDYIKAMEVLNAEG